MILEELKQEYDKLKDRVQELYQKIQQLREELQMLQEAAYNVRAKAQGLDTITDQIMNTVDRACACGEGLHIMESYRDKMNSVVNGANKAALLSRIDYALSVGRQTEADIETEKEQLNYELQNNEQSLTSLHAEMLNAEEFE